MFGYKEQNTQMKMIGMLIIISIFVTGGLLRIVARQGLGRGHPQARRFHGQALIVGG